MQPSVHAGFALLEVARFFWGCYSVRIVADDWRTRTIAALGEMR